MSTSETQQSVDFTIASKETLRAAGQVQSVTRSMALLNALSHYKQGLTLSEVAKIVGLANSTAHRLLTTMQNDRFVRFEADRSVWLIGVQAFRVGSAFLASRDVVTIARPFMRNLMQKEGETVSLAVEDRGDVVYLCQVETSKMMRAICGPGGRAGMHCSGIGKVLLAASEPDQLARLMASSEFSRETSRTIGDADRLLAELDKIRNQGFAVDDEEVAIGLRCVAAPIFDENGFALAGISLSGPTARIDRDRVNGLGIAVRRTADEITRELGGTIPTAFSTSEK